jgi:hypothetical protein
LTLPRTAYSSHCFNHRRSSARGVQENREFGLTFLTRPCVQAGRCLWRGAGTRPR